MLIEFAVTSINQSASPQTAGTTKSAGRGAAFGGTAWRAKASRVSRSS